MLITETLLGTENKVENAIETLKLFEPPEGYYVAFSGGKDSICIKELCNMAGVKYDAHYRITSVDPPELVQFIKKYHPDVAMDYPRYANGKVATMWNLIPRMRMPPTNIARYCCEYLKESGGVGRMTVTGVRWAESAKRKNNQGKVSIFDKENTEELYEKGFRSTSKKGLILVNDNTEAREVVEGCYEKNKVLVNPIIDWEDEDVWEFIKLRNLPYCELYDQGYERLGCIGCPMDKDRARDLERYPKHRDAYLRAFGRMLEVTHNPKFGNTPEDVMRWWFEKSIDNPIKGQIGMDFEERESI